MGLNIVWLPIQQTRKFLVVGIGLQVLIVIRILLHLIRYQVQIYGFSVVIVDSIVLATIANLSMIVVPILRNATFHLDALILYVAHGRTQFGIPRQAFVAVVDKCYCIRYTIVNV